MVDPSPAPRRLVTWNINSIRTRHSRVVAWLERHRPDVVALQETKCTDATFADLATDYVDLGYEWAHWGRDHWNGVAILSRCGLDDVQFGFAGQNRPPYDECRLVSAVCGGLRAACLYVPNGRTLDDPHYLFKLVWLERLRAEVRPDRAQVLLGDFNVAPTDADIYDPARWKRKTHASPAERAAIDALLDRGLIDVTRRHRPEPGLYTWWGYRPGQFDQNRGLRIDLALATRPVADNVEHVWVDTDERAGVQPSDHAPLVIDLRTRGFDRSVGPGRIDP